MLKTINDMPQMVGQALRHIDDTMQMIRHQLHIKDIYLRMILHNILPLLRHLPSQFGRHYMRQASTLFRTTQRSQ